MFLPHNRIIGYQINNLPNTYHARTNRSVYHYETAKGDTWSPLVNPQSDKKGWADQMFLLRLRFQPESSRDIQDLGSFGKCLFQSSTAWTAQGTSCHSVPIHPTYAWAWPLCLYHPARPIYEWTRVFYSEHENAGRLLCNCLIAAQLWALFFFSM